MCFGAEVGWGAFLAEEAAAAAAAEAAATAAAQAAAAEAAGSGLAGAAGTTAGTAAGATGAGLTGAAASDLGAGAGLLGAGLGAGTEDIVMQAMLSGGGDGMGLLPAESFGAGATGNAAAEAGVMPQDMALADPESAGWYMRTGGNLGPQTGTNMAWDKWANTMAQMNNLNRPQQGVAARAGGIYPQKQQGSFQSVGAFGGLLAPANTRRKK